MRRMRLDGAAARYPARSEAADSDGVAAADREDRSVHVAAYRHSSVAAELPAAQPAASRWGEGRLLCDADERRSATAAGVRSGRPANARGAARRGDVGSRREA